jgi:mRNA interferase RelE/StbE
MYHIRLLKAAASELEKLDKTVARRIIDKINWLANNAEAIRPKHLTGDLRGLYKLREGDYRIIYGVLKKEKIIIIHLIGHRRDVYGK